METRDPHRLRRRPLAEVLLLSLVLAAGCAPDVPPPAAAEPSGPSLLPRRDGINVLVVSFDALRADALSVYGYPRPTSPNIDAFAERSLLFERAYAASPITPTSLAAAWSGQLPHLAFRRWRFVADTTVDDLFATAGYRTAAFVNNVNMTEKRRFDRAFDDYRWYRKIGDPEVLDDAVSWLEEHGGERFFLWLHFNTPHAPYEHRELAAHLYEPGYEGRFRRTTGGVFHADDPAEVARIRSLYDGEVLWADTLFGRLMERLEALGRDGDTLVVLTTDHGEEHHERGGFQHKLLYEEVIRIPLLVHHPDRAGGARVSTPVSHVDLLPTLARIAGVEVPPGLDGVSFQHAVPEERVVVSEALTNKEFRAVAAVRGDDKMILHCRPERAVEWFDLAADPGERDDRADAEMTRVRQLHADLASFLGGPPCRVLDAAGHGGDPTAGLDPASIRELRALGYVE